MLTGAAVRIPVWHYFIHLVSKAVFHLLACGGMGVLIVPKWPSASFWPLIFKEGCVKRDFVKDVLEFNCGQNIFVQSKVPYPVMKMIDFSLCCTRKKFCCRD